MRRALAFLWKGALGTLACASLPLSVLAVGWTQRAMQRAVVRRWHGAVGDGEDFAGFASADAATRDLVHWPGWIAAPPPRPSWRDYAGSLLANLRLGVQAAFNTWVLTLPPCALWLFAWYDGWNNSFTKGYEQAAVGPLAGLLGVGLFIAAMFYVPLAQARQAATGAWRSFYDFSLVWGVARRRRGACVRLAVLYALLSIPVMVLKTAPIGFDRLAGYAALDDAAALELLQAYFLWAGAFVFGAYVVVRLAAARVYADGIVAGVRTGAVAPDQLGRFERATLERLDLLRVEPAPAARPLVRAARGASRLVLRTAAAAGLAAIWLAFVAQIFVSEFLNYHPAVGWLNQPLVQLPWFRYVPPGLGG